MDINLNKMLKSITTVTFWTLMLAVSSAHAKVAIEHWTTTNGARVYFVQAQELPMIDIRIVFDAGSARDGSSAGLAQLTNTLLTDAAGEWSANEVAERLENVGAERGNGSLQDMAWLTLRTLNEDTALKAAFEVFATSLRAPAFLQEALERERNQMLVALRYQEQSPSTVGSRAFMTALYGSHPYAHPPGGTVESIAALSRADVLKFFKRYYVANNAVLAIVGDLTRRQAEQHAQTLSSLLKKGKTIPPIPLVVEIEAAQVTQISHPATQSHVFMGHPGVKRGDQDYFPLYVGNHILGGSGLVSRLNEEIREKRGLSYSIYSHFSPMREFGPFRIGLQTRNDQTGLALTIVRETLQRFVDDGPTEEELEAAKKNITGGFPLRIDSNRKIVEYLAMIGFYNLPLDYLDTFSTQVNHVSKTDIKGAFSRRVHPTRMVTVVVGQPVETQKH